MTERTTTEKTTTARRKRRHVAKGTRIAATGIGVSTMLGLVGAMGYSKIGSAVGAVPTPDSHQRPVVVVIHRTGSPDTVAGSVPAPTDPPTLVDTSKPTVLRARPTVRPSFTRSHAPAASTSGSR